MYKSSSIIMSPLKIQLGGSYSVLTYYLFRVLLLEINVKLKIIRSLVGNTCSKWLIWNILNTCSKLVCLKYLESWILEILVQSFRENTWTKTNLEKPSQYCYHSSPLLFLSLSSKGSILVLFIHYCCKNIQSWNKVLRFDFILSVNKSNSWQRAS